MSAFASAASCTVRQAYIGGSVPVLAFIRGEIDSYSALRAGSRSGTDEESPDAPAGCFEPEGCIPVNLLVDPDTNLYSV